MAGGLAFGGRDLNKTVGTLIMVASSGPDTAFLFCAGSCFCGPRAECRAGQSESIMTESAKVRVEPRDPAKNKGTGTRVARRLRTDGADSRRDLRAQAGCRADQRWVEIDVWHMIKTPGHLAELDVGGTTETVLIRDVQWDHLGKEILHLDFTRVSAEEMIETEVALELRGTAAGIADGRHPRASGPQPAVSRATPARFPTRSRSDVSNLQVDEGHARA